MQATYSPDDNKLRLYPVSRLDSDTYARVKAAGFKWAPRQELFVAPMWTPQREDLLLELCGEIDDEDTTLTERAEERSERFSEYSEHRADDAHRAREAVSAIADNIPLGQPILVGHHSERHARKDAEKIENGMRRAVKMWETSNYWKSRAAGAIHHAKYKELPAVRARRIKKIEADRRKENKVKQQSEMWLKLWTECGNEQDAELQREVALRIAGGCWLHLPRKEGDKPDFDGAPTAYDAITNSYPMLYAPRTIEEIVEHAKAVYPRSIARCERWIEHYEHRLEYERAMLGESGGTAADQTKPEKGGGCKCLYAFRGGWAYIQRVNKVSVTVHHTYNEGGRVFRQTVPLDKLSALMTKAEVDAARKSGCLDENKDGTGFFLRDEPVTVRKPARVDEPTPFDTLKEQMRAGVQVVSAPQLFPTPPDLARRMVQAAGDTWIIGRRVLEPSAGTGNILQAVWNATTGCDCVRVVAVEINQQLADRLRENRNKRLYANDQTFDIRCGDFLECNGDLGKFDAILMNPPFANGQDIKHIKHAITFLKPGGRLVAICANGPRQNEQLKPLADSWEELPADAFKEAGTGVHTAMMVVTA